MPNITPIALAFELAKARRDGIQDAATLLDALAQAGQSPSVAASALAGMVNEACSTVDELAYKVDAETEAKAAPKPKAARRVRSPETPSPEAPSELPV